MINLDINQKFFNLIIQPISDKQVHNNNNVHIYQPNNNLLLLCIITGIIYESSSCIWISNWGDNNEYSSITFDQIFTMTNIDSNCSG